LGSPFKLSNAEALQYLRKSTALWHIGLLVAYKDTSAVDRSLPRLRDFYRFFKRGDWVSILSWVFTLNYINRKLPFGYIHIWKLMTTEVEGVCCQKKLIYFMREYRVEVVDVSRLGPRTKNLVARLSDTVEGVRILFCDGPYQDEYPTLPETKWGETLKFVFGSRRTSLSLPSGIEGCKIINVQELVRRETIRTGRYCSFNPYEWCKKHLL